MLADDVVVDVGLPITHLLTRERLGFGRGMAGEGPVQPHWVVDNANYRRIRRLDHLVVHRLLSDGDADFAGLGQRISAFTYGYGHG